MVKLISLIFKSDKMDNLPYDKLGYKESLKNYVDKILALDSANPHLTDNFDEISSLFWHRHIIDTTQPYNLYKYRILST